MNVMNEDWEGLPKPGTRVRVVFADHTFDGIVTSISHVQEGPMARVRLLQEGSDEHDQRAADLLFRRDEMEIISAA
jgi:hypothetical protein